MIASPQLQPACLPELFLLGRVLSAILLRSLQMFYRDQKRFAYSFQHYVLMSRVQEVRDMGCVHCGLSFRRLWLCSPLTDLGPTPALSLAARAWQPCVVGLGCIASSVATVALAVPRRVRDQTCCSFHQEGAYPISALCPGVSPMQDKRTRNADGKHLRVLERSIFSDRQVSSGQAAAARCFPPVLQPRPCMLLWLSPGAHPIRCPMCLPSQVFVRAMHSAGNLEDFEVGVYNEM